MNVKWCIERDFFWEFNPDTVVKYLKKLEIPYSFLKTKGEGDIIGKLPYTSDECVLVYGSIGYARKLDCLASWIPGTSWLCDKSRNLHCSNYYSYYGDFLFNREYMFTTLAEFERRIDYIYNIFGEDNEVFVRPDSPYKDFTGFVTKKEEFAQKITTMSYGEIDPNIMIIVAKPKKIIAEYRFYICKDEVITGSRYMLNGEYDEEVGYCGNALLLAQEISKHKWQPAPLFVADIGIINGKDGEEAKLLEINSFICSSMYSCDLEKIVIKANQIAEKEFKK